MPLLEPILGAALILLVLLDVFLTVLYARVNAGIISYYLACWMWRAFRWFSRPLSKHRDQILSFCGPCILVALVTIWVGGTMCGMALIIHPKLGTSVAAQGAPTPRDFTTAIYVAGDAITTVGSTEFRPQTPFFRLLVTFGSVIGISMITLVLTYFLEIYNALQARNTYAVKLHNATSDTGDAAELIAGVGAHGQFQPGYTHLAEMSAEMIHLFESHHFYGVLLYFRFQEPYYALSRIALITLDTVTLIKSALDDKEFACVRKLQMVGHAGKYTRRGERKAKPQAAVGVCPIG